MDITEQQREQQREQFTGAVAEMLGGARVVGYRPCFARAFGGASSALLLSQFWFWTQTPSGQQRGRDGWFWKSQHEITEETGLTRRETETARRKLRERGVLHEDVRGIPATLHFRLDVAALARVLRQSLEPPPARSGEAAPARPFARNRQTGLTERAQPARANPPDKRAPLRHANTERTSENQKANICTPPKAVLPAALKSPERKEEPSSPKSAALTAQQRQVNQQGTARLKAALQAAHRDAAPREPPDLPPPQAATPP